MTDPDFLRRRDAAKAELARAGVSPRAANPPLFRLLAALGLPLRPPHYLGFGANALIHGVFFGPVWGFMMYLLVWRANHMTLAGAATASLVAGMLFGIAMAGVARWQAKRQGLSRWQDL